MITEGLERRNAEIKVELHLHTQMSAMDGVSSVDSLVSRGCQVGTPCNCNYCHGVLQALMHIKQVKIWDKNTVWHKSISCYDTDPHIKWK